MIRGLYSAASGLVVASEQQEVTAHNLAHASTPGYRQRGLVYETFDRALGRAQEATDDLTGSKLVRAYHDFRPGPLQQTGHDFDLALAESDEFFTVAGPNGPLYTRSGAFRLAADGQLVTEGGYAVQGDAGAVTIPPNTAKVIVSPEGTVTADGTPVGRLQPVRFADRGQLTAAGPTLYTAPPDAGATPSGGRVLQGYREGANVQPADAMVQMILGARYYEAAQRALRTQAESIQLNTRPQG